MQPTAARRGVTGAVYDLLWGLGLGLSCPYLAWRARRYPEEMRERWGHWEPWPETLCRPLWMHAASLGELRGALPLLRGLGDEVPEKILSVLTPTARAHAAEARASGAALVRYAPADFGPVLGRTFRQVRPRGILICETEVWPGLLMSAAERSVPLAFVNARLTARGARRLRWLRPWLRGLLRGVSVAAQSEVDRERWILLGVAPERLRVTGNTKYAAPRPLPAATARTNTRGAWQRIVVFGSIRSGEYAAIAEVVGALARLPEPVLAIVAPRHPDQAEALLAALRARCGSLARRDRIGPLALPPVAETRVLVLQTLGELGAFYALADLAFVGGTLAPIGGHNLFEAAECALPVFFGPHIANVADVAVELQARGGGICVRDARELATRMQALLAAPERLSAASTAARSACEALGGAVERTIAALREWGFPLT